MANLQAFWRLRGEIARWRILLTGTFAAPVAKWLCREAGFFGAVAADCAAYGGEPAAACETIACLRLPLTGTRGFEQAQVTAGGVETEAFDPATLESRLQEAVCGGGKC